MSPSTRILAPIGLASTDADALAALIAQVPAEHGAWRIGDVADADLVVVDLDSTDGVIGQADAITQDIPCVALDVPGGLARPLGVDALVAVLASVPARPRRAVFESVLMPPAAQASPSARSAGDMGDGPITRGSLQFGFAEPEDDTEIPFDQLFSPDLVGRIPDGNAGSATVVVDSTVAIGPDASAHGDAVTPAAPAADFAAGADADVASVSIENAVVNTDAPVAAPVTQRVDGEGRTAPFAADGAPAGDASATDAPAPAVAAKPAAPRASYPLVEYLTGKLIGLPSRIAPAGLPALVLDPQQQAFHADGDLATLAGYFELLLPRTQWMAVLPSQLAEVRARVPGRPYAVLRFWHALRGAARSLAPHLDPGGTYALRGDLPLAADLPRVQRVLAALAVPRGLAEVASQSGTSVVEVYEVVSALDAIGQLAWTPRKRPGTR